MWCTRIRELGAMRRWNSIKFTYSMHSRISDMACSNADYFFWHCRDACLRLSTSIIWVDSVYSRSCPENASCRSFEISDAWLECGDKHLYTPMGSVNPNPERKIQTFRNIKEVLDPRCYHYSKWLCGLWSTGRDSDGSFIVIFFF